MEHRPSPSVQYAELAMLSLIQGAAMSMWLVPLSTVLDANGLHEVKPLAFAATAVAAFVSPLIFGAMADRLAPPVKVLRGLAWATAAAMALASLAIQLGWNRWLVLGFIQLHALCSSPTWSITSTIVFARLRNPKREFGPLRAMATVGWMGGCWLVSALNADATPLAGYAGAGMWVLVALFTWLIPVIQPPPSAGPGTWQQRLGLDALGLLKNADHRVIYITVALFNVSLAAFYPYTPPHLKELGLQHTTAWMSLGQVTEILAMLGLAGLLTRWRLKWIIAAGLGFGVVRFGLCALDTRLGLLAGITLHGCSFTLVYITAQIYLNERVDSAWRARAQALMSLMTGGVGSLVGFLGGGWWFAVNTPVTGTRWPVFWLGLTASVVGVLAYFLLAYHGRGAEKPAAPVDGEKGIR